MKPETYLARLATQGDRRVKAQRDAALAMAQIERLARAAHRAGARKTDIARSARISRPTLDAILRGPP